MDKDEALRLALEALEEPKQHVAKHRRIEAIIAIKEVLAQTVDDIEIMIAYLLLKVKQRDWHGVADAAMDIREMQAREKKE